MCEFVCVTVYECACMCVHALVRVRARACKHITVHPNHFMVLTFISKRVVVTVFIIVGGYILIAVLQPRKH